MKNKNIYNFNVNPSRIGTQSEKYDALNRYYGSTDVDPFWVADMDLQSPKFLVEALEKRVHHAELGAINIPAALAIAAGIVKNPPPLEPNDAPIVKTAIPAPKTTAKKTTKKKTTAKKK